MIWRRVCVLALFLSAAAVSQPRPVDSGRSLITIHVDKAGLFSRFGHRHEIRAPIAAGAADEQKAAVEFIIHARDLKVLDPDVDQNERSEVQQTMIGPKVLDVARFPEIRFISTAVQRAGAGEHGAAGWIVQGDLTLHGQTRPVSVRVFGGDGKYRGVASLKQSDYGIKPITLAAGTVKVKDELRIEFEIDLAPSR